MSTADLREPVFWILATLTQGRQHGYAILQSAKDLSGGTATLPVTTLYASLERLEKEGLVQSDGDEVIGGRLRRYFALTPDGESRLEVEVDRLEAKTRAARALLKSRPSIALGGTA